MNQGKSDCMASHPAYIINGIMAGRYSHRHVVSRQNRYPLHLSTIQNSGRWMHEAIKTQVR